MNAHKENTGIKYDIKLIGFSKIELFSIFLLLIVIFSAPYMFTQWSTGIVFQGMGDIGDVIGGVTAPFVNLLAAYMVYKSFTAQIRANAQQREDHNTQMAVILNDQTINFLMNLYNNMEKDYFENDRKQNEMGWANYFIDGFHKIDKFKELTNDPSNDYELFTDTFRSKGLLEQGIKDINSSINKIFFIHHNFSIITDVLLKSLESSNDKNVIYTARYISTKIYSLFSSNNYNSILKIDIDYYVKVANMNEATTANLKILKETAKIIETRLLEIDKKTEKLLNKK